MRWTYWSLVGHLAWFWVRSQLALSWQPNGPYWQLYMSQSKNRAIEKRRKWQTVSLSDPLFPWRGNPGVIVSTKYGFDCLNLLFVCVCACVCMRKCVCLRASLSIYLLCFCFLNLQGVSNKFAQHFNHVDTVWNEDNLQVTIYSQDSELQSWRVLIWNRKGTELVSWWEKHTFLYLIISLFYESGSCRSPLFLLPTGNMTTTNTHSRTHTHIIHDFISPPSPSESWLEYN